MFLVLGGQEGDRSRCLEGKAVGVTIYFILWFSFPVN